MELAAMLHEIKAAGLATLYFFCCFLAVVVLKRLTLAGALIVGKVVVVLDNTSIGNRFEASKAPWVGILYKTLVYTAVVLLVVAGENSFMPIASRRSWVRPRSKYGRKETGIRSCSR